MKMLSDHQLRRDVFKLTYAFAAMLGTAMLFVMTPALSTPTICSVVLTMLLSPVVAALERKGYHRSLSILLIFLGIGTLTAIGGVAAARSGTLQWSSLKEKGPEYLQATVNRMRTLEETLKSNYTILESVHPTESVMRWAEDTGKWFVVNGPGLMGDLLASLFLVPILTFVLLNDGRSIRKRIYQLVPNRFFEIFFLVSSQITASLSDYIRAKLVEAFLVGFLTFVGLALIQAPYAIVLGIVAGVTNIVPYLGPIIGAVPGLLIVSLDPSMSSLILPVALVYLIVNVIDMVVIFPVVVAKLVNLHPLILIAVVALGQQYYGLIGMLISIPIATAIKVVIQVTHQAVYEQKGIRRDPLAAHGSD